MKQNYITGSLDKSWQLHFGPKWCNVGNEAHGMYWFKCYHMGVYVQGTWLEASQQHIS